MLEKKVNGRGLGTEPKVKATAIVATNDKERMEEVSRSTIFNGSDCCQENMESNEDEVGTYIKPGITSVRVQVPGQDAVGRSGCSHENRLYEPLLRSSRARVQRCLLRVFNRVWSQT